jgi:Bacterial regulatory helix-turn-helix protein, lysR family
VPGEPTRIIGFLAFIAVVEKKGPTMRFKFDPRSTYAGRLDWVSTRPIENQVAGAALLRLEFLIFRISEGKLSTSGQIASRDIVLWPAMEKDAGVARLAEALVIEDAYSATAWLVAASRRAWMTIRFGDPSTVDQRQPFNEIRSFGPDDAGHQIGKSPHQSDPRWSTVQAAASELGVSSSTVRRIISSHEDEFGESLVRRTAGRHRRINLLLLRLLRGGAA